MISLIVVGSHLALLCIHGVHPVYSRNGSKSWWQYHKIVQGIIIIITITIIDYRVSIVILPITPKAQKFAAHFQRRTFWIQGRSQDFSLGGHRSSAEGARRGSRRRGGLGVGRGFLNFYVKMVSFSAFWVGTTVFRGKFPKIPRASLPNSAAHRGKSCWFRGSLYVWGKLQKHNNNYSHFISWYVLLRKIQLWLVNLVLCVLVREWKCLSLLSVTLCIKTCKMFIWLSVITHQSSVSFITLKHSVWLVNKSI